MNARTQVTLDPEMQRQAQRKAEELGISFAEYVRRLVSADLAGRKRKIDMSVFFDLGASSEPTDVARDKDRMLGKAVWDEHRRKMGNKPRKRSAKRRNA